MIEGMFLYETHLHTSPVSKCGAKFWLILSVCLNLGMLVFFKYTNFIIENLSLIPSLSGVLEPIEGLTLPIGISFYTFQIMSYSIDLYRGATDTQRSYISFGAYVALFPQLIAGPIVRYRDVDDQLMSREHSVDKFASGVSRFTVGFAKKILLGAYSPIQPYYRTNHVQPRYCLKFAYSWNLHENPDR